MERLNIHQHNLYLTVIKQNPIDFLYCNGILKRVKHVIFVPFYQMEFCCFRK